MYVLLTFIQFDSIFTVIIINVKLFFCLMVLCLYGTMWRNGHFQRIYANIIIGCKGIL